jgi:hypothetical protein
MPYFGYGYLLWLLPGARRQFALVAANGQRICVDPSSKLVMVQTALESSDESWRLWSALVEQFANLGLVRRGKVRPALAAVSRSGFEPREKDVVLDVHVVGQVLGKLGKASIESTPRITGAIGHCHVAGQSGKSSELRAVLVVLVTHHANGMYEHWVAAGEHQRE